MDLTIHYYCFPHDIQTHKRIGREFRRHLNSEHIKGLLFLFCLVHSFDPANKLQSVVVVMSQCRYYFHPDDHFQQEVVEKAPTVTHCEHPVQQNEIDWEQVK